MYLTRAEFYSSTFSEPSSVSTLHVVSAQINIFELNFMCKVAGYIIDLASVMLCCQFRKQYLWKESTLSVLKAQDDTVV